MKLAFTKMHGLGNDFVILDARERPLDLSPQQAQLLAHRRRGVGCDQVLLLEPTEASGVLCRYRVFNADGTEVEQCGNGMRCLGLYLLRQGEVRDQAFQLDGRAGRVTVQVESESAIAVNMGVPRLDPKQVPFLSDQRASEYAVQAGGQTLSISAVSLGNPHAVLEVDDVARADVARLGPLIEHHERFPNRANVGFMQVLNRSRIRLRVHERGTGETPACGSGACAAVVAGGLRELLDGRVTVELPGGNLVVQWGGEDQPAWMTGPAALVFQGEIEI